jgi:hypothetical protein
MSCIGELPGLAKLILKTSFNREFKPLFTYEILIQPYIWKTTFIWYTLRNFFLFRLPFFSTLRSKLFKFVLGNYNGYQYLKFDSMFIIIIRLTNNGPWRAMSCVYLFGFSIFWLWTYLMKVFQKRVCIILL